MLDIPTPTAIRLPRPHDGLAFLRQAIDGAWGPFAVVSSFGADSALLLALVAEQDRSTPILFLDTLMHFPETLRHRDELADHLGLTGVRDIRPDPVELRLNDPDNELHQYIPDDCCAIRKVAPLERALSGFTVWATGRRRDQAASRTGLPFVEQVDGRTKINPLADWTAAEIAAEVARRGLPRHPLLPQGFRSIGCAPCTRATRDGEDARAGRWTGFNKVECGIHRAA